MTKLALTFLATAALATATAAQAAESRDEAAVRTAENRWSEAFVSGDAKTLEDLLDRGYVSVSASGKSRGKSEIIGLAAAYAAKNPGQHAQPISTSSTIQVIGDAAVVRHHSASDVSVDVFYRRGGRWVAWYSQHTALPTAG